MTKAPREVAKAFVMEDLWAASKGTTVTVTQRGAGMILLITKTHEWPLRTNKSGARWLNKSPIRETVIEENDLANPKTL